jgi:SAM-dependent methyltransferase
MSEWLTQAGYSVDELDSVWRRSAFAGIAYSDGDEFEQRIEKVLREASDRSLFSPQLAAACTDWPSYYHLSCTRANLLRPLSARLAGADVLEVGAGCGAITRFLGELGATVCALEGSRRRARIARLRTAELQNVRVVAENFETFETQRTFDVVTFVGVLEYANQFVGGEVPACTMLERARALLKPGGIVVIAIENQLGLKYFAGAPEDHIPQRMFGIEDRYPAGGVRTYGRVELESLLEKSGFLQHQFYAPFPDYKFPLTIFSEDGMLSPDIDAHAMLQSSIYADRQLTRFLSFNLSKAWSVVLRNRLGIDLANSFLIVAGDQSLTKAPTLAWHYSTSRAPHFCKELMFEQRGEAIFLQQRLLNPTLPNPASEALTIDLPKELPFVRGSQLSGEFVKLLTSDGWSLEDVACVTRRFLSIAEALVRAEGINAPLSSSDASIPGRYLDLIPQNIINTGNDQFVFIDREWNYNAPVSASWLIFRTFCGIFAAAPIFGKSVSSFTDNRLGFLVAVFEALGFSINAEQIAEIARTEAQVQSLVAGNDQPNPNYWGPQVPLSSTHENGTSPVFSFAELIQRYETNRQRANHLDALLEAARSQTDNTEQPNKECEEAALALAAQIDSLHSERDELQTTITVLSSEMRVLKGEADLFRQSLAALQEEARRLSEERDGYQRTVHELEQSASWRVRAPLRAIASRIRSR